MRTPDERQLRHCDKPYRAQHMAPAAAGARLAALRLLQHPHAHGGAVGCVPAGRPRRHCWSNRQHSVPRRHTTVGAARCRNCAYFTAFTCAGRFGESRIVLSSANTHSYKKVVQTLAEYVSSMQPRTFDDRANTSFYHFGDNDYGDWTNFSQHYTRPPFTCVPLAQLHSPHIPLIDERTPFFSFGLGGSGSGVPFHTHGAGAVSAHAPPLTRAVFAEVLHGHKRWFVTAPHIKPAFDPDTTSFAWLNHTYPRVRAALGDDLLECTLGPGQVQLRNRCR